jgi:hypothetical protein
MLVNQSYPQELTRRKALLDQLMTEAIRIGHPSTVHSLLELNSVCTSIDFMVVQHYQHLRQFSRALEMLLDTLDTDPYQSLSCAAIKNLLEPFREQMDHMHAGLESLN